MVQINGTTVVAFYLQMVEVMEGSGVYWYPHQRAYCSAFKNWPGYINASIDIFFNKQIQSFTFFERIFTTVTCMLN